MKLLLILGSIFWVLSAFPGGMAAMMAPMMIDDPASAGSVPTLIAVLGVASYPLAALAAPVLSWLAFRRGRTRRAAWWMALPVLPAAAAVAALTWIDLVCGGRFACPAP